MSVIDFRLRAPYKSGKTLFNPEGLWSEKLGFKTPESIKEASLELLLKEMDEAGVDIGVFHGRIGGILPEIKNEDVAELVEKYPDRFVGLAIVDPIHPETIVPTVEKYVVNGKLKGITLEPALSTQPEGRYELDSEEAYIAYKQAEKYQFPVLINYGGGGIPRNGTLSLNQLRKVIEDFSDVNFILGHGGWPYTKEVIHLAFFHQNLYISPDVYATKFPGAEDYITAAKGILKDQIIYGSAYPFVPVKDLIDWYRRELPDKEVQQKVTYENAAKVLGL